VRTLLDPGGAMESTHKKLAIRSTEAVIAPATPESASTTFFGHFRLVIRKAFEEFDVGKDMLVGTFIALFTLAMVVYYRLIDPKDWSEHKWLWILCTVAPYLVVLGGHAALRFVKAPSLLYREQERKAAESDRLRLQAENKIYDGRPIFVLEIRSRNAMGWWTFHLRNCGLRTARYVRLQSVKSQAGNYHLHFGEISVLEPNKESAVRIGVNNSWELNQQDMLLKFLLDNPKADDPLQRIVFAWFDVEIKFRDMDESVGDAVVRFSFDVDSQTLGAHAVPYTERPSIAKLTS
jgi:hypothetical protein